MNFTRRNIRFASAALVGLSLATFGDGIVSAAPAPEQTSVTQSDGIVSETVYERHWSHWAEGTVKCDSTHPYLVLDESSNNASRFFRHATFHTGDNAPLRMDETITPEDTDFGPNFTQAYLHVQVKDVAHWSNRAGHNSVTIYCASTLEAAHQK
ncbi:hypothetical protein LQL77_31185 [Rhodococcus cerastii]|nr:hypothetical protein [Rhodococcus cerastii]